MKVYMLNYWYGGFGEIADTGYRDLLHFYILSPGQAFSTLEKAKAAAQKAHDENDPPAPLEWSNGVSTNPHTPREWVASCPGDFIGNETLWKIVEEEVQ